jgi:hypothetical protein
MRAYCESDSECWLLDATHAPIADPPNGEPNKSDAWLLREELAYSGTLSWIPNTHMFVALW